MATIQSITSGNFTSSSTWKVAHAATFLDSRTSLNTFGTTPSASSNFTPGAITIEGISLQLVGRLAAPTGTMTVELWNSTSSLSVKTVTINIEDLPNSYGAATAMIGWTYFKFNAPVTLLSATLYSIRLSSSVTTQVYCYTNGVAANWSRALITSTTKIPEVTDTIIVCGSNTGAGIYTTNTVTMDSISSSVVYGAVYISTGGVLKYGVSDGVNYALKIAGNMYITTGGSFIIGDVINPIPSTSNATFEIVCTVNAQYAIYCYGSFTTHGAVKTYYRAKLNSDISTGATTAITDVSTGWKTGDIIIIPSTTRTYTQGEIVTMTSNASTTSLPITTTVNQHGGDSVSLVQADIANVSRNIAIFSTSPTFKVNIQIFNYSITDFKWTSFSDLGTLSANGTGSGVYVQVITIGSFSMMYCTMTMTTSASVSAITLLNSNLPLSEVFSNNIVYRYTTTSGTPVSISGATNDGNIYMLNTNFSTVVSFLGSNNVISSNSGHGLQGYLGDGSYGNNIYANAATGYYQTSISNIVSLGIKIWRNQYGMIINGSSGVSLNKTSSIEHKNMIMFGNQFASITFNARFTSRMIFTNYITWGGTDLITTIGIDSGAINSVVGVDSVYFNNCIFGKDHLGNISPFSTAILRPAGTQYISIHNSMFFGTEVVMQPGLIAINTIQGTISTNHNKVVGYHRMWTNNGTHYSDFDTIYSNVTKSLRISPASLIYKSFTPFTSVAVKTGQSCTISTQVKESSTIGIETQYNGNPSRLLVGFNPLAGILTELVGDTFPTYNPGNLLFASQDFNSTTYIRTNTTVLINDTYAPDGRLTANKIITNSGSSFILQNNVLSGSNTFDIGTLINFNVYVKYAGGLDAVTIVAGVSSSLGNTVLMKVNIITGEILSSVGGTNYLVEPLTDGWFRISFTKTISIITNNRVAIVPGSTTLSVGDGTGIYAWGAQWTVGEFPTPYTPLETPHTLSYTSPVVENDCVLNFYVDCDGTTGWINTSDWKTTTHNDTRQSEYWGDRGSLILADWRKPGGSYTFVS